MLVFDPSGTAPITNITQSVSEYLNVGYGVGVAPPVSGRTAVAETDGLAALSNLVTAGAAVFTSATAAIDPIIHVSYWNKIKIAQGPPGASGATVTLQLETLGAAGITSISLLGGGNQGESLAGSAVTNRASYNYAHSGTSGVGEIAAVNFPTKYTDRTNVVAYESSVV